MNRTCLLSFCLLSFLCSCKENKPQPNLLFILADDLGVKDLGFTGSGYYESPALDALAKESFVFVNGYAASRVCSPSRASIMTGKFTARHGITDWIGAKTGADWRSLNRHDKLLPAEYLHALPAEETTIAEAFRDAGYETFFAGKWHLGGEGSYPEDHGFDHNMGGFEAGSPLGGYFSPWDNPKLTNKEKGENLSMRLAKETASFIGQDREKPFFAFLSFYAVHGPIQTTQEKWAKYRNKAEYKGIAEEGFAMERVLPVRLYQDNPVYAGLVETMDEAIALVLSKLKEKGLYENTIIVFTSDNGGVASGDSYSTSNQPFRGGKGYQWEGGIREPFLIHIPGQGSQKLIQEPVIHSDFYPTLLDLASLPLLPEQHQDGQSLLPLIQGEKSLGERTLIWHYPHYGNQGGEPSSIIRAGNFKLIHYWEDDRQELFDLASDPFEKHNLAETNVQKRDELNQALREFLRDQNANLPEANTSFDSNARKVRDQKVREELLPKLEEERKNMLSRSYEPNKDWWGSQTND